MPLFAKKGTSMDVHFSPEWGGTLYVRICRWSVKEISIKPVRDKIHFMKHEYIHISLRNTKFVRVVEKFPCGKQGRIYPAK